jgi:hypothetical protein
MMMINSFTEDIARHFCDPFSRNLLKICELLTDTSSRSSPVKSKLMVVRRSVGPVCRLVSDQGKIPREDEPLE